MLAAFFAAARRFNMSCPAFPFNSFRVPLIYFTDYVLNGAVAFRRLLAVSDFVWCFWTIPIRKTNSQAKPGPGLPRQGWKPANCVVIAVAVSSSRACDDCEPQLE